MSPITSALSKCVIEARKKTGRNHLIDVSLFEQYGGALRQIDPLPPSFEEGAVNQV
jgi:16S rRNA U1498 N3-methylase RsmE